jgi:hypothetical protein
MPDHAGAVQYIAFLGRILTEIKFTTEQRVFIVKSFARKKLQCQQCGFRRNRSTTDQIFCIRQILEEKWEYNEKLHQLFMDFKKAYDSVRREVLHNILI